MIRREFESTSPRATYDLGMRYGKQAQAGEVYALIGDLGVGKTAFAKGFAAGLGIEEPIVSPTFTIMMMYLGGRLPLYHFDVYRLTDPSEMDEVGLDEYLDGDGVCLIEWADQIEDLLPPETRIVTIEKNLEKGLEYRVIRVEIPRSA